MYIQIILLLLPQVTDLRAEKKSSQEYLKIGQVIYLKEVNLVWEN